MRYLDSGDRDPDKAVGSWIASEDPNEVVSMRFQTGYFGIDGLSPAVPILERLKAEDLPVRAAVGSNDGETLQIDLEILVEILGIPRSNAQASVVSFSRGLFHPKTYHLSRTDGSQVAYVGSANMTHSAVTSLNVEAGVLLDTRHGAPDGMLSEIADAIDAWASGARDGANLLNSAADIKGLVDEGIIAVAPKPRPSTTGGGGAGSGAGTKPSLSALIKIPRLKKKAASPPAAPSGGAPAAPVTVPAPARATAALPVVTKNPPYPGYVLFAPGATEPTSGKDAQTGTTLPSGASGLILRLNRDSARHFEGRTGTANISIPVPTLSSIRFGVFVGKYERPRANFDLVIRIVHAGGQHVTAPAQTGIMVYGFSPGESGHGDVRLVVPAAPAREIRDYAAAKGYRVPQDGDAFLLEWPTAAAPQFRATFFDAGVPEFADIDTELTAAVAAGNVVGHAACWMPAGYAPNW